MEKNIDVIRKAANALLNTRTNGLQYFPCVYYVGKSVAFTLNAAKRMAYGSQYNVKTLNIKDAWQILFNETMPDEELKNVSWNEDQRGELYGNRLYVDNFEVFVKV